MNVPSEKFPVHLCRYLDRSITRSKGRRLIGHILISIKLKAKPIRGKRPGLDEAGLETGI